MASGKAFDTPSNVQAVDGEVAMFGPDGVGLSLTPEAARETARRLLEMAEEAERRKGDGGQPAP